MAGVSLITGGKGNSKRDKTDFYPTPVPSTLALLDSGYLEYDYKSILEPAAGKGDIVKVVKHYYPNAKIDAFDLYDYGSEIVKPGKNFLTDEYDKYDLVITNPPYNSKILMPFVEKAIEVANKSVAMFLKITFLEGKKRYDFFKNNKMLKYVLVFSDRQPLYKNGIVDNSGNAICYAWYIWDKSYNGLPTIDWLRSDIYDIEPYGDVDKYFDRKKAIINNSDLF
jgi:hypothetical protein